jgi:hypothetical protein
MKRVYLILLLLGIVSNLFSQQWVKNLPQGKSKDQLTLSNYKDAFNQFWAPFNVDKGYYNVNGVQTKAPGWKQFKRWEYYMESQINPTTGEFPKQTALQIYRDYFKATPSLKAASLATLVNPSNWTSSGPTSSTGGYAGVGRISCIAFHPTDNNTYWVGAAAGGLWVTTNNGSSWSCLTDNNGVLAVSDIIIPTDYTTSNTIYIATGDKDAWDNNSVGVLKSADGGVTWNTTGINYLISAGKMVSKLLVDPANNQTLIAATSGGVFKTTDGGVTWSTKLSTVSFNDLEYKPGDFNTLYGSTTSGTIYTSTNGGTSWVQSFVDANARRIDLAVSANQPAYVYAIAANSASGLYGIYKSTNSGATFAQIFAGTTKNLLGWAAAGTDTGGQGWYDLAISVSPTNANTLLIGGVNTWRSTDGGVTWTIVNHWSGSTVQAVHADKHMLKYRNDGNLFECNDGGVYISANNGTLWTDKTSGMVISQMYKLGVSQKTVNETVTGLQDNGTKLLSGGAWKDVKGGDGMECLIDYTDANIQYGTYVNGQISRTTNHWSSSTDISANIPGGSAGAWVTPYLIDPINPQILYVGYADIWKTADRGNTWTKISSMATTNKIRSMAIAPTNTQVLYVADPSKIWKTTDNGTSWINITGTLPVGLGNITYITVKNNDSNTLWVTLSGYNASKVFQSVNGGTSWTDISAGLPLIPAYTIVQNKQIASEVQLYVGTEVGIYFKKGGDNWVAYNTGLPNVLIGELEIYYAANPQDSKLRAATYGRGLWESPVYYTSLPMTYASSTTTQNKITTVAQNQVNQEIIGIQVVTDGDISPLSATSFTINTTGSTNPLTDISNAKLFYTGSNNAFATTTQFGATSVSPDGTFVISGAQPLNSGTNYFWLTYDVPSSAVLGNVLDAQCSSVTVGTAYTPAVTNPSGSRTIGAVTYCTGGSPSTSYEYISNVTLGSINQASGRGTAGYQDYTAQATTMQVGVSYSAKITVTSPYSTDQILIWIDWNKNGDFTDIGENVYVSGGTFTSPHTTANFTPPVGTSAGPTRMRIRLIDASYPNLTPCGDATYGEVEDYTVNITTSGCTPPAAPTGTAAQSFCASAAPVIASLTASGASILWYSAATGGTALATTTALVNGTHYYASQTVGGCESAARLDVTTTVIATPSSPALGTITQPTCAVATGSVVLNGLPATGTWTLTRTPGAITTTGTGTSSTITGLATGTYTYKVTNASGCISLASASVVINAQPATPVAPTGSAAQSFCIGSAPTVASLTATGTAIKWYAASTGGTSLATSTALVSGTHYYASQTVGTCESTARFDVTVTINSSLSTPVVGTITQPTCALATGGVVLSGLPATGTWTLTRSPGSITTTGTGTSSTITGLVAGTYTYTVSNSSGCISAASAGIVINTQPSAPAAPTGSTAQSFCAGTAPTVASLAATGTAIKWYAAATGGSALATTTALVNGVHYYASQTVNTCESALRLNVTATVTAAPAAPTGSAAQSFCSGTAPTVASLTATGTAIKWYAAASGGTALATTTALVNTVHYYASQTVNTCESSARLNVTATVTAAPLAPTGTAIQSFCGITSPTVARLTATGTSLKWYAAATGGTALATTTALVNGKHYFGSQTVSGCESSSRLDVTATFAPAPTGSAAQSFCAEIVPKVSNLTATGAGIKWYAAATGGTALATTTALVNARHYYASQTVGTCESTTRLNVTATILATPTTPRIGTITQPTLTVRTGSVALSSLPSTGTWTLTRTPDGIKTTGTGRTKTITGLATGTYTYKVANSSGCTSVASANVVINVAPVTVSLKSANDPSAYPLQAKTNNALDVIPIAGSTTISVYPNPVAVSFTLKINNPSEGQIIVRMISSSGKKVVEFKAENFNDEQLTNISVSNLSDGIYVVQVLLNGSDLYSTKIVVLK